MHVYKVLYFNDNASPCVGYVAAENEAEASTFLGVRDGTAIVSCVAFNVEVVGVDDAHAEIPPLAVTRVGLPSPIGEGGVATLDSRVADSRTFEIRRHDSSTFNAADYAIECQNGTCDCAPICPVCRKTKCWDAKHWPGHHDWRCGECCQAHFSMPWKAAAVPAVEGQ
jgi:hypothetical protein